MFDSLSAAETGLILIGTGAAGYLALVAYLLHKLKRQGDTLVEKTEDPYEREPICSYRNYEDFAKDLHGTYSQQKPIEYIVWRCDGQVPKRPEALDLGFWYSHNWGDAGICKKCYRSMDKVSRDHNECTSL